MTDRANTQDIAVRRRWLRFRSWHRGTREADLLLGSFADRYLDGLSADQLERYDTLLGHGDPDLYNWMTGHEPVPEHVDSDVVRLLMAHTYSIPTD